MIDRPTLAVNVSVTRRFDQARSKTVQAIASSPRSPAPIIRNLPDQFPRNHGASLDLGPPGPRALRSP
jgi:hypothetical protein